MHYFSIRDIENLCGIKAQTLRIWEVRYKIFLPKRKESNHRLYDNEDLKQLLRIAYLYRQGWKISRLAQLRPQEILEQVVATAAENKTGSFYTTQLLEKAIDFDQSGFSRVLDTAIQALGFETCIVHVCYPLLQKIGILWMTSHVIPAQEHFCSYLIQHKIIATTDTLPLPQPGAPEILLFCPHGEYHELPIFFIHYLLRKTGWNSFYIGTSVSMDLLRQFVAGKNANFLFLHLITNFTGFTADDYLEQLCRAFPEKTIVASGAAALESQRQFTNLRLLRTDDEIYEFIGNKPISALRNSLHPLS
jgi:MerR family transcriptional regulator, light-induced transcriptional regulator